MKTDGMDLMRLRKLYRIIRKAERGNQYYRQLLDTAKEMVKFWPKLEPHYKDRQEDLAS